MYIHTPFTYINAFLCPNSITATWPAIWSAMGFWPKKVCDFFLLKYLAADLVTDQVAVTEFGHYSAKTDLSTCKRLHSKLVADSVCVSFKGRCSALHNMLHFAWYCWSGHYEISSDCRHVQYMCNDATESWWCHDRLYQYTTVYFSFCISIAITVHL